MSNGLRGVGVERKARRVREMEEEGWRFTNWLWRE